MILEIFQAIVAGACVPLVFSANWLAAEAIGRVRAARKREAAEAVEAQKRTEFMDKMGASMHELGRNLADGKGLAESANIAGVKLVADGDIPDELHAALCSNPNCSRRKGGGRHA